jgi:hypothetical protein
MDRLLQAGAVDQTTYWRGVSRAIQQVSQDAAAVSAIRTPAALARGSTQAVSALITARMAGQQRQDPQARIAGIPERQRQIEQDQLAVARQTLLALRPAGVVQQPRPGVAAPPHVGVNVQPPALPGVAQGPAALAIRPVVNVAQPAAPLVQVQPPALPGVAQPAAPAIAAPAVPQAAQAVFQAAQVNPPRPPQGPGGGGMQEVLGVLVNEIRQSRQVANQMLQVLQRMDNRPGVGIEVMGVAELV